ncbi:MAG TPA: efflux transporter outer membrane subunit [Steroidobacteraceae bacterium]|jgi:multidrug efflux system outer membrane protein|nr:efflux transporter outer membrane subunit [Steroidobacteraceae bacterium]
MRNRLAALAAALLVAACTVAPHYDEPAQETAPRFDQSTAEATSQPAGSELWSRFGSDELDALIQRAIVANTTIAQAVASLNEARALSGLSVYSWFPTVGASGQREKAKFSTQDPLAPGGIRTDTWRAGFDASWEIDLFGGLRNEFRAIDRRVQSREALLDAAQLSIVAETAQTWFSLIGARETLALRRDQLRNLEENVRILEARVRAGSSSALDLSQAEAQRRAVAASVPQAEAELVRQEQRLAVLTAWPIETLRANLSPTTRLPALPALVATGTPEEWMKRRPDIRAAERELAATYSDIGDEMAEYFPKITLLGGFGWTGTSRDAIGDDEAERWSYGPAISWRIFDFGRIHQQVKAAEARRDGQLARYQQTVLEALEETENALAGFRTANQAEDELRLGAAAASEAARLARRRYEVGAGDYLSVLIAERQKLDFEDQHVQAETRRATALAAVYKALAGDF